MLRLFIRLVNIKNLTRGLLISIIFLFGLSAGHYKHFPYNIFYYLKNGKQYHGTINYPGYYGRNFILKNQTRSKVEITERTGIYITYGQSNAANYGELGYDVKEQVYMAVAGETFIYKDPSLGAEGPSGGTVWGMLGDKLIQKGLHDKVVFANCAWGGLPMKELKEGQRFGYLVINYLGLKNRFGKVDGILFHHGEANNSDEGIENYYRDFLEFIHNLRQNGIEVPIYLSRVSLCGNKGPNKELTNIQDKLIKDFKIIKAGPNTDLLSDKKFRLKDNCHFSLEGYNKFSDMWVESIFKQTDYILNIQQKIDTLLK
jgi:hypothetical protein